MFPTTRLRAFGLLLLLFAPLLRADHSLDQARKAQTLLGSDIWSEIVRVDNDARRSRYPRRLHALVFELAGILWFYTPADGTQSFSLHVGRLAEEKADFGPLLRDIEPGFKRWSIVPRKEWPEVKARLKLKNGCFIESIAELRERLARGDRLERPRLLSYYAQSAGGAQGHTVLTYGIGDHVHVFNPGAPDARLVFAKAFGPEPLALARAMAGPEVVRARYVTIDLEMPEQTMVARNGSAPTRPNRS